ncbi:HNH endonuclease [Paenibacillus oenotherae]|uniref:HNH endonuclease n=1 Tax=Paenibacillus oenotherae TaxID=1435645 RepID=A0ABS7D353_9BACL|nr:HNH endonuclease signature motif containing protein [Paenibacillus oenotherae]MBW7474364.1 HNH endonuclease [Paenibacillus oenotherae]
MDVKSCAACGQEKPLSAYTKRSGSSSRRGTCRACMRRRLREAVRSRAIGEEPANEAGQAAISGSEKEPQPQEAAQSNETKASRKRRRRRRGKSRADSAAPLQLQGDPAVIEEEGRTVLLERATDSASSDSHHSDAVMRLPAEQQGAEMKPKRKRKRRRRRGKTVANAMLAVADKDDLPPVRPPDKMIVPFKGRFTYDPSVLNDRGTGLIRLRGRRETGKRWSTEIPAEMAVRMVEEGAAGIIHPGLIHKLYTKTDFRLLILQRDAYKCQYCGRYGDTIDHVQPKSKGGLSSPGNCVCACGDCNLKKADSLDFVYYDEF